MDFKKILPPIIFLFGFRVCEDMKKCICGVANKEGGAGNQYPWMVAIRKKIKQRHAHKYKYYTGTLVSDQFVVTTANVFDHVYDSTKSDVNAKSYEAKPGAKDWGKTVISETIKWQPIEDIWIHPYFNKKAFEGRDLGYNVALMKLKSKIVFDHEWMAIKGVRPICLPTPGPEQTIEKYVGKVVLNGRAIFSDNGRAMGVVDSKILDNARCLQRIPTKIPR